MSFNNLAWLKDYSWHKSTMHYLNKLVQVQFVWIIQKCFGTVCLLCFVL